MRTIARLTPILMAASFIPGQAEAHLMSTGFGPFYDGLAHPLATPEDLLPVVAMALLAGLGGARTGRVVLFVLPAAWLLGMAAGGAVAPHDAVIWLIPALTITLGALVAADRRPPLAVVAGGAIVLGLIHGAMNGAGLATTKVRITGALGVACTIFVVAALIAGAVVSLRRPCARIVVRVAGSWIAAIGLLMLGWSLRKGLP
jgi:hydrogenase/urease accessory protein HupE